MHRFTLRLYSCIAAALVVLVPAAASAQFRPQPVSDPATGETYHIEGSAGFWLPTAGIKVASEGLGQVGTNIDFKNDLGLQDQRLTQVQLVLRPAKKHKFRFEYIPILYDQSATLQKQIVFNGIKYTLGLQVNSTIDWKAYRFGYEYDFISHDRFFAGVVLEAKYTDLQVKLASPIDTEYAHAQAPIPAIGGIVRAYVVPNISITGELTGFMLGWIPESVRKTNDGHFADVNIYGTLNFTDNIGVQGGYRSFDVGYVVKTDSGTLTLRGLWFGVVARF